MEYKVGQILTASMDMEYKNALSEETVIVPKGSRAIVGADNLMHHFRGGWVQPLGNNKVKGYDANGIAEYLYLSLKMHFPIDEMLGDYDTTKDKFVEEIECALDEIGLC